jgi:hypothetical protein
MEYEETLGWLLLSYGSLQMIFVKKQSLTLPIGIIFCSSNVFRNLWLRPGECDNDAHMSSSPVA